MGLVSQSIKNLKGGISQQPDILRYDDQGAWQCNAYSSEVEGLQKRPPSVHKVRLGAQGGYGRNPLCHIIHRDERERYGVFFTEVGTIGVVNLQDGSQPTVHYPQGNSYLQGGNPRENLRMVTVADYTFIINKRFTIETAGELTPQHYQRDGIGLVWLKGGQYGKTFSIWVNGVSASYATPLGDQPNHALYIATGHILGELAKQLIAKLPGWSINHGSNVMSIVAPNGTSVNIASSDNYNGQLMSSFTTTVQTTTELPPSEVPGWWPVCVAGEAGDNRDDFYLHFVPGENVWREIAKPGILANLAKWTMPWVLIRQSDGSFVFQQADWKGRVCGDEDTNPWPSFVGQTISDVFFFRNRLGFISGENVILSEAGSYFNFFPNSVAVTADSDPIDVAVSTNRVSILKYAVPFGEELLLWSSNNQFVLGSEGILSPTSVKLDLTTEFEVSDQARPLGLGRGVYFVAPRASYSSLRRYYSVQDVSSVKNAEDCSSHVPSYIPNGVHSITGSSTENFITMLTAGAPNIVYMYKFLYINEDIAQQSWSHWDFGPGVIVLCCTMIGAMMYLVLDTPSGLLLETITFTQNTLDYHNEPYRLYIDRKIPYTIPTKHYYPDIHKTQARLSHIYGANPNTGAYYFVMQNGKAYKFDPPDGGWGVTDGLIEFDGDVTGQLFFVGEAYEMAYTFSKFLIKSTDSQGNTATEDIGRLQLRRAWVNYEKSGHFDVLVHNQGRNFKYSMTGQRLGTLGFVLGSEVLDTGQFRFPLAGNANKLTVSITSSTPSPVAIIGGGWEGNYVRRSSGI